MSVHHFRGIAVSAIATAIMLLTAASASARTYYLEDVTFDDGTVASGQFSANLAGYLTGWDITTQTGSITGYEYTPAINAGYNPGGSVVVFYHNNPSYDGFLYLAAAGPFDGPSPDALLTGGTSFECSSYGCPNGIVRNIVSGFVTTTPVPEPATWGLFLAGSGAVGAVLRRRRKPDRSATSALA